jgi:hypothetical protein
MDRFQTACREGELDACRQTAGLTPNPGDSTPAPEFIPPWVNEADRRFQIQRFETRRALLVGPEGLERFGQLLRGGDPSLQHDTTAVRTVERGCDGGDATACATLATLREWGLWGVSRDPFRSFGTWERACGLETRAAPVDDASLNLLPEESAQKRACEKIGDLVAAKHIPTACRPRPGDPLACLSWFTLEPWHLYQTLDTGCKATAARSACLGRDLMRECAAHEDPRRDPAWTDGAVPRLTFWNWRDTVSQFVYSHGNCPWVSGDSTAGPRVAARLQNSIECFEPHRWGCKELAAHILNGWGGAADTALAKEAKKRGGISLY